MKTFLNLLEKVINISSQVFISGIILLTFYSIVLRYVFKSPPAWCMEFTRIMFLWLVMLGAAVVAREKGHISINFFVDRFPPALKTAWQVLLHLMILAFCGLMIHQGLKIYPLVAEAETPTLGLSMGWLYLSVPAGGLLMAVYYLENLAGLFRRGG
ncbi:MAG: TRAP transporter small permease [Thermodesulfobacteriota bacterium]